MSGYYGWEPPASLDYSSPNCSFAAQWLSSFLSSGSDPSITTTYDYIVNLIPADMEPPDVGQVIAWFEDTVFNDTMINEMANYPIYNCQSEVCENLVWKGDPDLAGVGVMVVYYLAASLTTTYYIILLIDQWFPITRNKRLQRHWNWFSSAFRESISTFVDVSLIFAITMLVAGVYRHGSSRLHPDKTNSIYQLTNATYMSIFSIFPPLLLQLAARDLRRLRIRQLLWSVTIILAVTVTALYFTLVNSENRIFNLLNRESATTGSVWEMSCDPVNLRSALDYIMAIADAFLGLNVFWWAFYLLPPSFRTNICESVAQSEEKKRRWAKAIRIIKLVDGILSTLAMWTLLAVFTVYRSEVEGKMGESEDMEWSFGQVLSMATWVPVAIDLLTIYIYGAASALEGKVSERFEIVDSAAEKSRGYTDQQYGGSVMPMDYRLPQPSGSAQGPEYAKIGSGTGYNNGY